MNNWRLITYWLIVDLGDKKNISRFYCYIANDSLKFESALGLVTEWILRD